MISINVSIPEAANPRICVAGTKKPASSRIPEAPPRPDVKKCAGRSFRFSDHTGTAVAPINTPVELARSSPVTPADASASQSNPINRGYVKPRTYNSKHRTARNTQPEKATKIHAPIDMPD